MIRKILATALLLALAPLIALAEEPAPAAISAPAAEAPAPDSAAAAPAAVPAAGETQTADLPAAADNVSAQTPLGNSPTPVPGKRVCNMKGKGMMGMMDGRGMGPGKACDCPGHQGCNCGHGGGHGAMHQDVVQRLDLIEARLAKIEAMLESLMRR